MTMKKQALAALALLGATMGMGATPSTVPTGTVQQQRHNDAIDKQIQPAQKETLKELHASGGNSFLHSSGLSPKEYGQMLQYNRKQKWVKRKVGNRR